MTSRFPPKAASGIPNQCLSSTARTHSLVLAFIAYDADMDGSTVASAASEQLGRAQRCVVEAGAREGRVSATRRLLNVLVELFADSSGTPSPALWRCGYDGIIALTRRARRRLRDGLLGVFHSPYQPTESVLFHEIFELL